MKITDLIKETFKDSIKGTVFTRKEIIKNRDKCRGTGVYLAENMGSYYIQIGEFYEIENFCRLLQLKVEPYDPFETDEDDEQFNYWGSLGKIGPVKELDNETK